MHESPDSGPCAKLERAENLSLVGAAMAALPRKQREVLRLKVEAGLSYKDIAQVIADHLGVPFEDITVFEDDSSRSGFGPGAAGSRQAISGGGASISGNGRYVVFRDDESGLAPGVFPGWVELDRDSDNNGTPDGPAVATTTPNVSFWSPVRFKATAARKLS